MLNAVELGGVGLCPAHVTAGEAEVTLPYICEVRWSNEKCRDAVASLPIIDNGGGILIANRVGELWRLTRYGVL